MNKYSALSQEDCRMLAIAKARRLRFLTAMVADLDRIIERGEIIEDLVKLYEVETIAVKKGQEELDAVMWKSN